MLLRARTSCDVLVVGGGVVGCGVLYALARYDLRLMLVEGASDVGQGISRANTAIAHTGFDAPPGSLEATLVTRAHAGFAHLCAALGVAFRPCGALMVALDDGDLARLDGYARTAAANAVAVERLDAAAVRAGWPYLSAAARGALHIPGESSVDSFALTVGYAEAAARAGATLLLDEPVVGVEPAGEELVVTTRRRAIVARFVVNAAGLQADQIARMVGDQSFAIRPRKGQLYVVDPRHAPPIETILLPTPSPTTKGILITPAAHGNLLLGPTAEDGDDREDWATTAEGLARVREGVRRLVPGFVVGEPVTQYAGLRSVGSEDDYIIRPAATTPFLIHVAGIRSTGLSASPTIGPYVAELLRAQGLELRPRPHGAEEPGGERPDPAAGNARGTLASRPGDACVVCVCEGVTAGQVRAAASGVVPALTLDALKRRLWVTAGPCQGSRCLAALVPLLADAHGVGPEAVRKNAPGSEVMVSALAPAPDSWGHRATSMPTVAPGVRYDVVVAGGGPAGRAAANAAGAAGASVLLVSSGMLGDAAMLAGEAYAHTTLTGVERGLTLRLAGPFGEATVAAGALVLATGGREPTRGNLEIVGTRPAGVLTARAALELIGATGCLPGRRALVCGVGRRAEAVAERLSAAGVAVAGVVPGVVALAGWPRLADATLPSGEQVACDTLVLALPLLPWLPPRLAHAVGQPGVLVAGAARLGEVDATAAQQDGAAAGRRAAREAGVG